MLLAIDVGNTNVTFGVHDGKDWLDHKRIRTAINRTADEYLVLFQNLLSTDRVEVAAIKRAVLSSVVPPLTETLGSMVSELIGEAPLVVEPGIRTGIRIRTENPAEVGSDLVANAVAAYEYYKGSSIIVGFGTALTFTAITEPGDLLGVAIAPGLSSAVRMLTETTAQLPAVQLKPPPRAIGRNTIHSIQSGVIFGYVGMVEAILRRMKNEIPGIPEIIATGGQAGVLAPLTAQFTRVEPWLTLDGLRFIAERNT
jgi:type III pantothenate kinase